MIYYCNEIGSQKVCRKWLEIIFDNYYFRKNFQIVTAFSTEHSLVNRDGNYLKHNTFDAQTLKLIFLDDYATDAGGLFREFSPT